VRAIYAVLEYNVVAPLQEKFMNRQKDSIADSKN
jgi:hypothetical protein